MTPTQILLIELIVSNAITAAFDRVRSMSEDEVVLELEKEQTRQVQLRDRRRRT